MLYALVAELCLAFSLGCPSLISAATQTCADMLMLGKLAVIAGKESAARARGRVRGLQRSLR